MKGVIISVILLFLLTFESQAMENDSLVYLLSKSQNDTQKVNLYTQLSIKLKVQNPKMALKYASKGRLLAENLDYKKGVINNGLVLGQIFTQQGNFPKALKHFFGLESILSSKSDEEQLAEVYNYISLVYIDLNKEELALKYANQSKELFVKQKDNYGVANAFFSIASIYKLKKDYVKAKTNFEKSLSFYQYSNSNEKIASVNFELGSINLSLKNYSTAYRELTSALVNYQKNEDVIGETKALNYLGDLEFAQTKYKQSILYYLKSLNLSTNYDLKISELHSLEKLAKVYDELGDYKNALSYLKRSNLLKESIFNSINLKLITEMEVKFDTERQKRQILASNSLLKMKNYQIYLFRIGFVIFILLLLFFIYFLVDKTKINKLITKQKKEVEAQNLIIEEKNKLVENQNKDIRDSIKYAQRIQSAILPPKSFWWSILPNSFVIYKPKEVLSGDFHWIAETDSHIFVAAADCTGHGVPGAFISIVNYNLLNKAVLEKGITDTGLILDAVNVWLTESLHQTYEASTVKDGMDVSLISINKATKEVNFSGAYNSVYIVRNDVLIEYKGDKFPVGVFIEEELNQFKTNQLDIEEGDMLYLFTDGYADQFGGPKGKKYKYSQFRDQLVAVSPFEMEEQRSRLIQNFQDWKGDNEQVDDVLILGIQF